MAEAVFVANTMNDTIKYQSDDHCMLNQFVHIRLKVL